jgi:hypothetical protein
MTNPDYRNATRATTRYASPSGSRYMYYEYKQPGKLLGYRNDFVVQHFDCSKALLRMFLEAPFSLRGVSFVQTMQYAADFGNRAVCSKLNVWDVYDVLAKLNKTLLLPSSDTSCYEYFSVPTSQCVTGHSKAGPVQAFCEAKDVLAFARTSLADRDKAFAYLLHGADRYAN